MTNSDNHYFLRLEGVNQSNVLDDTAEISVRRSASLMLRQAILNIKELVEKSPINAITISSGASIGLFELIGINADSTKETVINKLNEDYPFLTFVVDIEAYQGNFNITHERLIAKNRYQQFQQMTLVAPAPTQETNELNCPCEKDYLHPAAKKITKGDASYKVSASVKTRFTKGKKQRQTFYRNELENNEEYDFTDDFADIARASGMQDYANLNDKMAVIYLDGNGFGKIQQSCESAEELQAFDKQNQDYRKEFLQALLKHSVIYNIDHKIFMETLLWGGDEMILVVPAWKGMELMQFFYKQSKDWKFKNPKTQKENKLSYAGGIVFCHHKTLISQVVKSAKELAENIKNSDEGRETAYFDYLVLESIDYPTQSITDFWKLRYGDAAYKRRTYLKPQQFPPDLDAILEKLPRGAIYEIAQEWINHWEDPQRGNSTVLEGKIERFIKVNKESIFEDLFKIFNLLSKNKPNNDIDKQHQNPAWIHLVELWDYLAPVNTKRKEG